MNIEQIQRINTLAVDLMKQGLAQDREEAVAQAEKIFRDKDPSYYNAITKTMEAVQTEENNRKLGKDTAPAISDSDVRKILEQNTQFLVKTIRTFQEKMAEMEKEMAALKNELRYQKLPAANQIVTKREAPSSEAEAPQRGKVESSSSGHPRSGNFKAEDVSIEKFFYYGG
ncbi:MAG: hypothetical protein Q8R37_04050 [Nanoarchaeota archaeon]|nr:hypothetical protein [Nanoarchaeota archaeon]